ncbi:DNA cytosine methyltransferase [Yeosuana marina]|uniref:DNA cytosine methyltransferase n=1 Tax=Yeosuana marina TaxID=1565536 RepID=UPI0030ECDFA1|tara:strand:- start:1618 stop:2847 length:1230 start_codon:yes stop_codon:yes gene_type:complete
MNFIDLFSGAGGLSEGFIKAGFNPIAHVEIDENACKTLETRVTFHKLEEEGKINNYYDYLKESISRDTFIEKFGDTKLSDSIINKGIGGENNSDIFRQINELSGNSEIDLIVGGPPCQAYSLVGRSRDKNRMKEDPRNHLYKEYAKFLAEYKPKIFVFENVLGLITANNGGYFEDMKDHFRSIGYEVEFDILNSSEYGVLQNRKRIILIGWRKEFNFSYPKFTTEPNTWSVNDLLKDLKKIKPGEQNNLTEYVTDTNEYLKKFDLRNGVDFVTQHIARPHNNRDLEIYKIAINKFEKGKRLKYPDLPERLKTHNNQKSFVDRFKVVDGNGLSHTMVAHIAKDGHHYIYPDKKQVRSLSVREAARIQSFPDNFFFEGGRTAAFKQIGNAVPPLMAFAIAKSIKELLCQKK